MILGACKAQGFGLATLPYTLRDDHLINGADSEGYYRATRCKIRIRQKTCVWTLNNVTVALEWIPNSFGSNTSKANRPDDNELDLVTDFALHLCSRVVSRLTIADGA